MTPVVESGNELVLGGIMLVTKCIDRFRLFGRIGRGGMGVVYGGFDTVDHRYVAVKTLFHEFCDDRDVVARFRREARLYGALHHPNVVECIASGFEGETHFIVLEWVEGESVSTLLKGGPFAIPEALRVTLSVAEALGHAHEKGIIHRDVKPSNVCINQDGWVKLLDFGIAHAEDEDELTETGVVIGTCLYASPEQNQGRAIDGSSDLYSLGVMLFEMLTGHRPWKGTNVMEVLKQQALRRVAPPSRFRSDIPPRLDAVQHRLVERLPERRYRKASELILELESLRCEVGEDERNRLFGDGFDAMWEAVRRAHAQRRYAEALEMAKVVEQARPSSAGVEVLLGKLYARQGLSYAATARFERALELKPQDVRTRLDFVRALYHMDMFRRAAAEAEAILERDEDNVFAAGMLELMAEDRPVLPAPGSPPSLPSGDGPSEGGASEAPPSDVRPRTVSRTLVYGEVKGAGTAGRGRRSERPDLATVEQARWLGLLFCGLGNLRLGRTRRALRCILRGGLLLVVVVGTFVAASQDLTLPVVELANAVDPEFGQMMVESGVADWVTGHGSLFLWVTSFLALVVLVRLWKGEADEAYRLGMVRVLSGSVCRRDGALAQIDVGGLQGVHPGQLFVVSKHVHRTQVRSVGEEVEAGEDDYFPVAQFTAEAVHPHFTEGHWRPLPGVTGTPLEGDPVTPVV